MLCKSHSGLFLKITYSFIFVGIKNDLRDMLLRRVSGLLKIESYYIQSLVFCRLIIDYLQFIFLFFARLLYD